MLKQSAYRDARISMAVLLGVPVLLLLGCSSPGPSTAAPATPEVSTSAPAASPFEHKMIRRIGNTPEDAKVYVVEGGKKHWVVNADWFAAHGYRFPSDMQLIPPDQFDVIPTGDPIR
jgi:hypothetical protein